MARKGKGRWLMAAGAAVLIAVVALWFFRPPNTAQWAESLQELTTESEGAPVPLRPAQPPASPNEPAGDDPAPPAAGNVVTIGLSEPPADWYLRGKTTGNERFYRQLVAKIAGPEAFLSVDLGRAAREFVFQYTELGREPPTDVRDFLIRSSGALAGDTAFQHVRTTSSAEKSLRQAIEALLKDPPDGVGRLVVGVGEVFTPGRKFKRHIGVVATHLPALLEPMPRSVEKGGSWRIRGRLLVPYSELSALALWPDGHADKVALRRDGQNFEVIVAVGDIAGALDVQLVGVGPKGPGKLVQLRAEVGRALPTSYEARLPPDEARVDSASQAERLAFDLLNSDRRRHGLPALQLDRALSVVAQDHSRDMRDNDFFSHRSPTTGLHPARLARAGYRASSSAENLALNVSIHEAEAGLMHSLGHRRNILHRGVTHVGLGVVGEERESGQKRWWVTQLFARPVQPLDAAAERQRVLAAIAKARSQDGLQALRGDAGLDAVADDAAQAATSRDLNGVTGVALKQARSRGLIRGRLRAWAALTPDLDQIALPPMVRDRSAKRVGVGLAQSGDESGAVALILLVGQ